MKLKKSMSISIKDWLTLIGIYIACLCPIWLGIALWILLNPSTFWQKIAMITIYSFLFGFQIIGIVFICMIQSEFNKKLKKVKVNRLKGQ
jgi:uncharacterized membrane protein YczE